MIESTCAAPTLEQRLVSRKGSKERMIERDWTDDDAPPLAVGVRLKGGVEVAAPIVVSAAGGVVPTRSSFFFLPLVRLNEAAALIVVYTWCTRGVHVVYTWCTRGLHVVYA